MSDSPSDELERIREQNQKELLEAEEDSGEDGDEIGVGDEKPPEVPIEIGSRGEFEHVVDVNQAIAGELGVRGVPTVVLFVDGEPTERLVGAQDRATLERLVGSA